MKPTSMPPATSEPMSWSQALTAMYFSSMTLMVLEVKAPITQIKTMNTSPIGFWIRQPLPRI